MRLRTQRTVSPNGEIYRIYNSRKKSSLPYLQISPLFSPLDQELRMQQLDQARFLSPASLPLLERTRPHTMLNSGTRARRKTRSGVQSAKVQDQGVDGDCHMPADSFTNAFFLTCANSSMFQSAGPLPNALLHEEQQLAASLLSTA